MCWPIHRSCCDGAALQRFSTSSFLRRSGTSGWVWSILEVEAEGSSIWKKILLAEQKISYALVLRFDGLSMFPGGFGATDWWKLSLGVPRAVSERGKNFQGPKKRQFLVVFLELSRKVWLRQGRSMGRAIRTALCGSTCHRTFQGAVDDRQRAVAGASIIDDGWVAKERWVELSICTDEKPFFLRLYCKGKVIVMRAAFYEVSWTTIFLPTLRDPWVCWIPTTALRGFPFHFVFQAQVLQTIHILLQSTRSESTLFCNLTAGWYLKLRLHWPTGWPSMLAASNWSETWHIWRLQVVFGSPWSPPRNQVVAADYDFRSLDLIKSINQPPPNKWMLVFFIHFFR